MNPPFQAPTPAFATPQTFASPQATPSSERALLRDGLLSAGQQARALGGMLGAVVIDLDSGAVGELNGDASLPMQGIQQLLIAVAAYGAAERGTLPLDRASIDAMLVGNDAAAAGTLMHELGGADALNAAILDLGFDKIVAGPNGDGVATPVEVAKLLTELHDGHILRASSRSALMKSLTSEQAFPGGLKAGIPEHAQLSHIGGSSATANGVTAATNDVGIVSWSGRTLVVVAMLSGAQGTVAQRNAVLAAVARAAVNAVP